MVDASKAREILSKMNDDELTLMMGLYARRAYLGTKCTLTEYGRYFRDHLPRYFPLVHPSRSNLRWQAGNNWFVAEVIPEPQRRESAMCTSWPCSTLTEKVSGAGCESSSKIATALRSRRS